MKALASRAVAVATAVALALGCMPATALAVNWAESGFAHWSKYDTHTLDLGGYEPDRVLGWSNNLVDGLWQNANREFHVINESTKEVLTRYVDYDVAWFMNDHPGSLGFLVAGINKYEGCILTDVVQTCNSGHYCYTSHNWGDHSGTCDRCGMYFEDYWAMDFYYAETMTVIWENNGKRTSVSYRSDGSVLDDRNAKDYFPAYKPTVPEPPKASAFADVGGSDWYFDTVNTAKKNGYINGYAGTRDFGPNDCLTRAQAAAVIMNMAGPDGLGWTDTSTRYPDVVTSEWYAKAVNFCDTNRIVQGYSNKNAFGPDDLITREQFACMMQNYARYLGVYRDTTEILYDKHYAKLSEQYADRMDEIDSTGVKFSNKVKNWAREDARAEENKLLSHYDDPQNVSNWARRPVEWCIAIGVMGQGPHLGGPENITRAECATMAVRYQPVAR